VYLRYGSFIFKWAVMEKVVGRTGCIVPTLTNIPSPAPVFYSVPVGLRCPSCANSGVLSRSEGRWMLSIDGSGFPAARAVSTASSHFMCHRYRPAANICSR